MAKTSRIRIQLRINASTDDSICDAGNAGQPAAVPAE